MRLPLLLLAASLSAAPAQLPVLWKVPAFHFVDQDGAAFTDRELRGHVWVADFIYTQCTAACPLLTARMKLLARKLSDHPVAFLSFSVDPEHDRPAALKAYAARWHGDERHWRLLDTGNEQALHAFVDAMQTDLSRSGKDGPIAHSESFVLIDAAGQVRGRYDSTDPDALAQLVADAAALAPSTQARAPSASDGRELFASVGCMGCHGQHQVAPALEGVAGHQVMLYGGSKVTADDAYLRASIVDPARDVVDGYPSNMPSYRGELTDAQLDALIAYLHTLGSEAAAGGKHVRATDPVCGMSIAGSDAGPHARYAGKTWYFCSESCRAKFEQAPARFAKPR